MRETRQSGSEGGEGDLPDPYTRKFQRGHLEDLFPSRRTVDPDQHHRLRVGYAPQRRRKHAATQPARIPGAGVAPTRGA